MTREIAELVGRKDLLGLYDSDTGEPIPITRVIDISDECHDLLFGRAYLSYFTPVRGEMVQIAEPYPEEEYSGSHIHYLVDDIRQESPATIESLSHRGRIMGINSDLLFEIILTHSSEGA